jgi:hypothetical protein
MTEETNALAHLREEWLLKIEGDGGYCPCCDRWGKIYKRPLNSSMARALMWLTKAPDRGDGWTHVPSTAPTWMLRSQQLATLHLWGLVKGFDSETKLASSGLWKPTPLGVAFAENRARVQRYVYVYNNEVRGFDGDEISIIDALGEKYNYQNIMANYNGTDSNEQEEY